MIRVATTPSFALRICVIILAIIAGQGGVAAAARKLPEEISFNEHIRPIMSSTCFVCHGPDEAANESGLRLDSFAAAVESGGAIVPGHPETSLVYARITDQDDPMPPSDFRHQLSDYQRALLRKWIEQGARYETHWAYTPIKRPAVPQLETHAQRVANEIDAFILARLEQEGIQPTALADKATLLRRLSLDLIGLPPTPDELSAYLADPSSAAYRQQVERLLASPRYGERMASQWLDVVRFSDTVGFHGDQNQRIFPYRDYVIDALNKNKPFDEFTREQLAGDLLNHPTDEQLTATGLVRLNMMTREGGAQPEEYLAKYTADRVRMIGTAWLGATTGCCECHHHKYDPLTIKDFYSLGAFFDDLRQWGVYTTYGYTPNPDLAGFTNHHPFPPELRVASKSLLAQLAYLEAAATEAIVAAVGHDPLDSNHFHNWVAALDAVLKQHPDGWIPVQMVSVRSEKGTHHQQLDDGSILLAGRPRDDDTIIVTASLPAPVAIKAIRLEAIPDPANDGFVGRSADGRFSASLVASIDRGARPRTPDHPIEAASGAAVLKIEFGQADRQDASDYVSGYEPKFLEKVWRSGPSVWQLPQDEASHKQTAVFHLRSATSLNESDRLEIRISSPDIGCFRLSAAPLTRFVAGLPAATVSLVEAIKAHQSGSPLPADQRSALVAAYYLATTDADQLPADLVAIRDSILACRSGLALTMIAQQAEPKPRRTSRVLPRGDWQDQTGEAVVPATPAFLPPVANPSDRRLTRVDLARWLTSSENPLTARHYVNRTWKHFFGAGLSSSLDDLGHQGEWPSHPRLLDWLAAEFRDTWDMKHLVRLIVSSNTYRQQAAVRSDLADIDPYNRLLAQQSARRLEAEAVRDNALAISGLLFDDLIGGPSVFPYQPDGHYNNLQFPVRSYEPTAGALQYRRGVYVHWQRSFLHPMLVNFDAPSRDECVADRTPSNSPQQALTLLNDPQFVEAGNALAHRLLANHPALDFDQLLDIAFSRAVARPASSSEQTGLREFYQQQKAYYAAHDAEIQRLLHQNGQFRPTGDIDRVQLAAWSQVCRVILNLHETMTRY